MKICSVPNCGRKMIANGLCCAHYQRAKHNDGNVRANWPIGASRSGENNSHWKGGLSSNGDGRSLVYTPDYPGPKVSGVYVLEYRLIAEKVLGRRLREDEVV